MKKPIRRTVLARIGQRNFLAVRRAEQGHYHQIAGPYLLRYAQEASWREDNLRISNGEQVHMVSGLAMKRGASVDFCGYCQRNIAN